MPNRRTDSDPSIRAGSVSRSGGSNSRAWGDIISTVNIALGGIALMYILDGGENAVTASAMIMFLILVLDGIDGPVAHRTRKTPYGPYLDSISDGIGFVILPALLVYSVYYVQGVSSLQNPRNALIVAVLSIYIAVGFHRLAHFAVGRRKTPFFVGAPVSLPAVAVVAMYGLDRPWWVVLIVLAIMTVLVASKRPFPKMRGVLMAGGGLTVGLGITAFYLDMIGGTSIAHIILYAVLFFCGIYACSPTYYREKDAKRL